MVFTPKKPPGQVLHPGFRTQTKIKNYFYGNIRYFLKVVIRHFHRKSTGLVNDIKTDTLLDLYEAKNSITQLTQTSRAFRLFPRPSVPSDTASTNTAVKRSSASTSLNFKDWPACLWRPIFQKNVRRRKGQKNQSRRRRVRVGRRMAGRWLRQC